MQGGAIKLEVSRVTIGKRWTKLRLERMLGEQRCLCLLRGVQGHREVGGSVVQRQR